MVTLFCACADVIDTTHKEACAHCAVKCSRVMIKFGLDVIMLIMILHVQVEGGQIDVIMQVEATQGAIPATFAVELFLGCTKAVRVFPDWQLPAPGSNGKALLHVTVTYRAPRGKFPVRMYIYIYIYIYVCIYIYIYML